jgi:hypothetical protein
MILLSVIRRKKQMAIKGKAIVEFGTGSVSLVPLIRDDGLGVLCLASGEPGEIGRREAIPEDWTPAQADVILTFTNHESILTLIHNLSEVYKMTLEHAVNPALIPDEYWGRRVEFDLEKFMEDS